MVELETILKYVEPFGPWWLCGAILCFRLPQILKEVFTHIRQNKRLNADLAAKRAKTDAALDKAISRKAGTASSERRAK